MALDSLTVTISEKRVLDGLVVAANSASMSPEAYCSLLLERDGRRFADSNDIGVVTSAAFVGRFTPQEYSDILAASVAAPDASIDEQTKAAQVKYLLDELFASPYVALDDSRAVDGVNLLVSFELLAPSRPEEILSYVRPEPRGA